MILLALMLCRCIDTKKWIFIQATWNKSTCDEKNMKIRKNKEKSAMQTADFTGLSVFGILSSCWREGAMMSIRPAYCRQSI